MADQKIALASNRVAALFVETDGIYFGIDGVDPWDKARDATQYGGPHPVVAHPPCPHWSLMGQCRGYRPRQEDYDTFAAALEAVETYGGVLEHPAHTKAWRAFCIPKPPTVGWGRSLWPARIGWTTSVDQAAYGHPCHKETWLYFVGGTGKYAPGSPPKLDWQRFDTGRSVRNDGGGGRDQRSKTPPEFRDLLLDMARNARRDISAEVAA